MSVEFYRESPGKFDSRNLNRKTLNRWTWRNIKGWNWLTRSLIWAFDGWHYSSNAACLMRPPSLFACFSYIISIIIIVSSSSSSSSSSNMISIITTIMIITNFGLVSRIAIICYILCHSWRTRALDEIINHFRRKPESDKWRWTSGFPWIRRAVYCLLMVLFSAGSFLQYCWFDPWLSSNFQHLLWLSSY